MKNETDSQRVESVEIKHGHWILDKHGNWVCEFCGNAPYHSDMHNMNYCPNCGAKLTIERDNITTHLIWNEPTVDAEPTEEQVKEYCRKRNLVIVEREVFNEMKEHWLEASRVDVWAEPDINPCRGCDDYDGRGGCKSAGGCGRA